MMSVHPDQANPNYNYRRMTCRACIQPPLDVYGIDASINTHMLLKTHTLIVHFTALDNEIKPDIGTLKKDRGDIFSKCRAESFKGNFYFMSMNYYLKWFKQP